MPREPIASVSFGADLSTESADFLLMVANEAARVLDDAERPFERLAALREALEARAHAHGLPAQRDLLAHAHLLIDLSAQGWRARESEGDDAPIDLELPAHHSLTREDGDLRRAVQQVRRQLKIARDEQLRESAPRVFVESMRIINAGAGHTKTIRDLMRDGRELVRGVEACLAAGDQADERLSQLIRPYVQVITDSDMRCEHTGLALQDIWRYFRYTWATPSKSVPGRTMNVLIRDAAVECHPVIGLGALSSAVVNLGPRDEEIGWAADDVVTQLRDAPTDEAARWLDALIDDGISEIYLADLFEGSVLTPDEVRAPTDEAVARLQDEAQRARDKHVQFDGGGRQRKRLNPLTASDDQWRREAETHLFRSKRAKRLATLLRARRLFAERIGGEPTAEALAGLLQSGEGRGLIRSLILKAKADRVGINIADVTICGALPPYNELLGGKLVSMLMTSPEVVAGYRARYRDSVSVIASSMAGRAILRPPTLVFLATTSLYGRSSQYNRLVMPLDHVDGPADEAVRYKSVGFTRGTGTLQFARETTEALNALFTEGNRRVNNVFGEGVNPRMRMIREALGKLELDPDMFLSHGNRREIFAIHLIRNTARYLLGFDAEPDWLIPQDDPARRTEQIVNWWRARWLFKRAHYRPALDRAARHRSATRPVRHGARVQLPPMVDDQLDFFDDIDGT